MSLGSACSIGGVGVPKELKLTPLPLFFTPVHASAGSRVSQRFWYTVPVSNESIRPKKSDCDEVQMDAVKPYGESFINLMASSSPDTYSTERLVREWCEFVAPEPSLSPRLGRRSPPS